MEGMEYLPKETWEDKFCKAVEDLQRVGVRPKWSEDDDDGGDNDDKNGEEGEKEEKYPERSLQRMKDAYERGGLKIWVADINMDNLPEVPRKNRDNYAKGSGMISPRAAWRRWES